MLAYYMPYQSNYVGSIEGMLTACLAAIAWGGAMGDLMFKNKNSQIFLDQLFWVDIFIQFLAILVITLVVWSKFTTTTYIKKYFTFL